MQMKGVSMLKKWKCIVGGLMVTPIVAFLIYGIYTIIAEGQGWKFLFVIILSTCIGAFNWIGLTLIEQCIKEENGDHYKRVYK